MPTRDEDRPQAADHAPRALAEFASDCARCTGLCCTALPYRRSREFAADKPAGRPCHHLGGDFGCRIHARLRADGWPGCTEFECFGAGPKATSRFAGRAWGDPTRPETADSPQAVAQFETFLTLRPLQEARFHLRTLPRAGLPARLRRDVAELDAQASELADSLDLTAAAVGALRERVGRVLREVSAHLRGSTTDGPAHAPADHSGRRWRGRDLTDADLRGSLLIAADLRSARLTRTDLLGADLRDADVRGADLSQALFLTQPQLNAAVGDERTRVPAHLRAPAHWTSGAAA